MFSRISLFALRTSLLLVFATVAIAEPADELVLVAGATGRTGQKIVAQLREQGYEVRALVRNAESAAKKLGTDIELVVADVRNPESLGPAFDGVTLVISSIGTSQKEGPNSPEFVDYGGNKNLVDAAINAKARQFVLVSSMGVTHEDHVLNRIFGNVLIWKLKSESYLQDSGITYTVIRPGGLHDRPGGEKLIVFEKADAVKAVNISRTDVASVCVAALAHSEAKNKIFSVFTINNPPDNNWQEKFAALD